VKVVKIIAIIIGVLVALVIIVTGAGVYLANRYLQSPAFKEQALQSARTELGTDVAIDNLKLSIFRGVELRGVTIGNPPGFSGDMVTADAFVLHYRLLPLFHRRVEIEELSLDKPVVTLARNSQGQWNYEKIGAPETEAKTNAAAPATPSTRAGPATAKAETSAPLDVVLSKLAITRGALSMVGESNKPIVKVDGVEFSSSVSLAGNRLTGTGKAGIDKIDLSGKLVVRKAGTQVTMEPDHVTLSGLRGELAGGTISGNVSVKYATGLLYAVSVQLTNSDVAQLLQDAGSKPAVSGKLTITTSLTGTGGVPTIVGSGRVEVDNGKLMEIPLLNALATVLQIDALNDLSFSQCLLEYSLSNNVLQTPVIRLTSPQVQITGNGSVALDKSTLNHNMRITFARGVFSTSLVPGIRELFVEQPDGSLTLDFKVTGPYNRPKTDIAKRLGQNIGKQLLQNGLQEFLGK